MHSAATVAAQETCWDSTVADGTNGRLHKAARGSTFAAVGSTRIMGPSYARDCRGRLSAPFVVPAGFGGRRSKLKGDITAAIGAGKIPLVRIADGRGTFIRLQVVLELGRGAE